MKYLTEIKQDGDICKETQREVSQSEWNQIKNNN
jgi:hypothetical protein